MSENKTNKHSYLSALIQLGKFAWGIFIGISILVTVATMVTDFKMTKEHPVLTGLAVLAVTIFISLILLVIKMINEGVEQKSPLPLSTELVNIINTLYEKEKYLDVVRLGSALSRYLWLKGKYHERIEIGERVEDAAGKESRIEEQVSSLIDDIGWTYNIIGQPDKAVENIKSGIDKALTNELFYYAAKGERHLSGIEKHKGHQAECLSHLQKAKEHSEKILDLTSKNEMEASLFLAEAKYLFELGKLNEAEALAEKAIAVFKNDPDRIVKIHSLLGNIYLKQNKLQKAKDEFNKGYNATKSTREDEVAKNLKGLADIALLERDIKSGLKYLNEAKEIYLSIHKNKEATDLDNIIRSIRI